MKAASSSTYEMIVFKKNGRKTTKKVKTNATNSVLAANRRKNIAHLLRLAGAKTLEEMKAAGGEDNQP